MNERVKILRKTLGLTLEKFGERLGMKKNTISQWENGINNLTDPNIKSICREYNVNEEWLRDGTGEMFILIPEDEEVIRYTQELLEDQDDFISDLVKNFIVTYKKLDDTDQEVLRRIGKELFSKMAKKDQP